MKSLIINIILFLFVISLSAQKNFTGKITEIVDSNTVKLSVNNYDCINVNDIFPVYNINNEKKLKKADTIGKIKIIIKTEKIITAKIILQTSEIKEGYLIAGKNKTVNKNSLSLINKNAIANNYNDFHIIDINNDSGTVTIDKGRKSKIRKCKPDSNKKYFAYLNHNKRHKFRYLGSVKINSADSLESYGKIYLQRNIEKNKIIDNNILLSYRPKNKGWHHIVRLNFMSYNYLDGKEGQEEDLEIDIQLFLEQDEYKNSYLNGLEFINGYVFSHIFFTGLGIGYNKEYHLPFKDADINNFPVFIHSRFNFYNSSNSITLNISAGKNYVLNSETDYRPYKINSKYYLAGGLGFRTYIKNYGAFIFDIDLEFKDYTFENYIYNNNNLMFLKLKLGFEPYYSPLN